MKRQYLGDSKDSFKWDYHHYLVDALGYPQLQIALMMTPDDNGRDGRTSPHLFPARPEILEFCIDLRRNRDTAYLANLSQNTSARYDILLYKPCEYLANPNRFSYFANITDGPDQVFFLDPDNGFEPESGFNEKHVRYTEVDHILNKLSANSVITVFQHQRRKTFEVDFTRIQQRLLGGASTAICWQSLMFVSISRSVETIGRVHGINAEYAKQRPAKVLA